MKKLRSNNLLRNLSAKISHFSIYLIIIILIAIIIAYFQYKIQPNFGPLWDTCDFLILALEFTGKGVGYVDLIRPPVMSFLTSIFFRMGYISENVIFAIDGILFVFGVIGLYLLLNLRFNPLKSFIGCLLYSTFPIMLLYISVGLSDIPSVSFSIYAIYFTALAFRKNSKFFYIAFPFVILSFLTRYPMAIIIFPLFLYIMINRAKIKNQKDIVFGIILSLIVIIPFLIWSYLKFANPFYPFMPSFNVTSGTIPSELFYYNADSLYFLKNLPSLVGNVSIIIILFIIYGFIFHSIKSKFWLKLKFKNLKKMYSKSCNWKLGLLIISVSLFFITFGKIFYMFSEVIFLIICFLFYELLKNYKFKNLDMDLLFFSWFMSFFIFHSVYVIKDFRYFITMTPAFSYFLILGLNNISSNFKLNLKSKNVSFQVISVFLIIGLLFSTTNIMVDFKKDSTKESDIILASNWFKNYDPNYKNKVIYSEYYPYLTWHLKTEIKRMPILMDNKEEYSRLKYVSLDNNDFKEYEHKLLDNNADYYFCVNTQINLTSYNLTSYTIINKFGDIYIYEKIQ